MEEFHSLVETVENPSLSGMVAVLGETGIRKGEALNLKWAQVDFGQKILTVEQTKSGKVREVPLSPFAVNQIQRQTRYFTVPMCSSILGQRSVGSTLKSLLKMDVERLVLVGLVSMTFGGFVLHSGCVRGLMFERSSRC